MRVIQQFCCALSLLAMLALIPSVALAQDGVPGSDLLKELISDHNALVGAPDVPLAPPARTITIPEAVPEGPQVFEFGPREINFLEATTGGISDRLSIGPYAISVRSDDEVGLPQRTNAVRIPASALEAFLPFSISASSDGNAPGTANQPSDHLTIITGYYGPGSGTTVFDESIVEVTDPATEPDLVAAILPAMFDVYEPGKPDVVSDYVDLLGTIPVRLISSDDPHVYANLPAAQGFVVEDFQLGGGVTYSLGFVSDTEVPEPSTMLLMMLGGVALRAIFRGRRR